MADRIERAVRKFLPAARVPEKPLRVRGLGWLPSLVCEESHFIYYRVPSYMIFSHEIIRIRASIEEGWNVVIGLNDHVAAQVDTYEELGDNLSLFCISELQDRPYPRPMLDHIVEANLRLPYEMRQRLASYALAECEKKAAQNLKGLRLESLVAFVFAHCEAFRVKLRRYKNISQEFDLVLQRRQIDQSGIWKELQGPFILVEARNQSTPTEAKEIRDFWVKLHEKHRSVGAGIFVSLSRFTEGANIEINKYRDRREFIVPINRKSLRNLIETRDMEPVIENHFVDAMLA